MEIEIRKIKVKHNFREDFNLKSLVENMGKRGLLQPIVITRDNVLVAGERRLRAAKELGWKAIDCHVRDYEVKDDAIADGAYENLRRASYRPGEQSKALAWLKEYEQKAGEVTTKKDTGRGNKGAGRPSFAAKTSEKTGISERTVKEKTRIGERASASVLKALDDEKITQKQALQICRLETKGDQDALLKDVVKEDLPLCDTTEEVNKRLSEAADTKMGTTPKPKIVKPKVEGIDIDRWLTSLFEKMNQVVGMLDIAIDEKVWEMGGSSKAPFFMGAMGAFISDLTKLAKKTKSVELKAIGGVR